MIVIHPINEENLRPHYGNLVCAVMHDGTHHYGILNGIASGQLILNADSPAVEALSSAKSKEKTKSKTNRSGKTKYSDNNTNKAQTSAFGFGFGSPLGAGSPFGFGGRLALDLAAIALLFAVIL